MESNSYVGTGENNGKTNLSAVTGGAPIPVKTLAWAAAIGRVNHHLFNDLGGGPRPWKQAWVINFQKLGTLPLLGVFIALYHNTSTAAWDLFRNARHLRPCLDNQRFSVSRP
jgi:hypothetical protein